MTSTELLERAAQLRRSRTPFVHAQVVLAEPPTSAKPGDEAIVLADGTVHGFVGGSCVETSLRAQSRAVLDSGSPLLLRVSPVAEAAVPGKLTVANPCLSGGALEIFLSPQTPAAVLAVHGSSPIATALGALGEQLGFCVVRWGDPLASEAAAVVVASHGRADEEGALTAALRAGTDYVGLVASRTRGAAVLARLDVGADLAARVHTPAGLDIGARTAPEIALSILAEILAVRRGWGTGVLAPPARGSGAGGVAEEAPVAAGEAGSGRAIADDRQAVDPVCAMTVATVPASLSLEHAGRRYWFCGPGCQRAFAADPGAYLSSS